MNGGQFFQGIVAGGDSVDVLNGLVDNVNAFVCSLVEPKFSQIRFDHDNCPNGLLLPAAFHGMNDFCDCYNKASKENKKCLTIAALQIHLGIKGIVKLDALVDKCCAQCGGIKYRIIRQNVTTSSHFFFLEFRIRIRSGSFWSSRSQFSPTYYFQLWFNRQIAQ